MWARLHCPACPVLIMLIEKALDKFAQPLTDVLGVKRTGSVPALAGSAGALIAWAMNRTFHKIIVWICDGPKSLECTHQDMITLAPRTEAPLLYYPPWEILPGQETGPDPDIAGCRLNVLQELQNIDYGYATTVPIPRESSRLRLRDDKKPENPLIATCVQALMQTAIPPAALRKHTLFISLNDEMELDDTAQFLIGSGHEFGTEVREKGHASKRGGLLDVWPLTETWPLRIEFSGPKVESIRSFNPVDQRSTGRLDHVIIPPANERHSRHCLLSYLPDDAVFVWSNPDSIQEHASVYEDIIAESGDPGIALSFRSLQSRINRRKGARQLFIGPHSPPGKDAVHLDIQPIQGVLRMPREAFQPDIMEQARHKLMADLHARAAKGQTVIIYFDTQGSLEHFKHQGPEFGSSQVSNFHLRVGILSEGFAGDSTGLVIVAESDLYGVRKIHGQRYDPQQQVERPERIAGARITDLVDMEPGDLVVHMEHGVGKYLGLYEIMFKDQRQEVLSIEYADNAKLHVPVTQAHLLSRYVGISRHHVQLHRLGGKRWNKQRAAAELSILDLASSLLETQAQRSTKKGYAFPPDRPWQHEFEASFHYRETADQQKVIVDVKHDMESQRPMDRLVCGDAGYGKTEIAMRAAFKAVMEEKQAAMLVPTTVLAQQHYQTFNERMSVYPIRIEMLSRFCSRSRNAETVEGLADGTVDIVIGTHALIQPGIRFKNLGLVVIDEEQRFGVAHKEWLKQIRRLVDVLTLTATPIPRTLYMSMTGARDMSLLQTPPLERMAIETIVAKNTDKVVREAILLEINREGQVFYLYNRVMTIEQARTRLERLVPEARIEIAHGRMASSELASVMRRFTDGEFEVLLCTTIIESGMDIPRANTILIDRADRFGMADLYQLRGRVGRSSRKAYAYLLLPSHGHIDSTARRRIGAVKKYSSLSAGFNLALRDLEIRGAGNLLGAEQSGHITAIGFGLYCQLLNRAVARLKGEPVPPVIDVNVKLDFISLSPDITSPESSAIIPYGYIEDEPMRIEAYRKIAETASLDDILSLDREFIDRFGPVPSSVQRLLKIAELRIVCTEKGISRAEVRDGKIMLVRNNDYLMKDMRFPRLTGSTPDEKLDEIIELVRVMRQLEAT